MENIIKLIRGLVKDTQVSTRNTFEYVSSNSFKLSESYIKESSIKVYRNGTELQESDFSYSADSNAVIVDIELTEGDIIQIVFEHYAKYSDTEIKSYICANLVRFTQKRYKKSFSIEDDEIVDAEGEAPTKAERDVIAIITAIDIDPQNVEIRTRDFTVTATENKSKSEQFNEVFAQFDRGFISLDYLESQIN
jgi:hypothetical protein